MKKETEIDSLRKSSLMWWNNELTQEQRDFHFSGYEKFTPAKHSSELTGREIQNIWAVNQNPPTPVKETEPRFDLQDLDEETNIPDLQKWVNDRALVGLIDEERAGIIGYINSDHIEEVVKILNGSKETEPAPTPTSKEGLEDSEIRVYGIDSNLHDGKIFDLTNNDFVHIAEEQGYVWTLAGFESAFNSEEIAYDMFIRFINPVKEQL